APRYGVAPISRRTLFNLLDRLEAEGFISRALVHIKGTWVTQRHLLINYDAVGRVFKAVLNWAIEDADAAVERKRDKKLHSGGQAEETPDEASSDKALAASAETESCTLITNRSKDKNKGEPSASFFEKFFKEKASEVQSLQKAARLGKITASGAKKLIKIHNEYGYPVADKFRKFLNFIIVKGKSKQVPPNPEQVTSKSQESAAQKPPSDGKEFKSSHCRGAAYLAPPDDHHVKLGLAEYYRDEIGRIQIRWLDKDKIKQAATGVTSETTVEPRTVQAKNEPSLAENCSLYKRLQSIRKLRVP
ncbi:MAG: hypothetical protein ACRC1U_00250, partial [Vibrionaceae bacterium]